MSTTRIDLIFDGPGVKNGTIDASLLAESLTGYSRTYLRANELLNGEVSEAVVLVQAEFRKGSFIVDLQLVQTVVESAKQLISAHSILDSAGLVSALGFAWSSRSDIKDGVIDLIKWLKGKKPDSTLSLGSSIEVTLGANKKIVTNNVYNLYGDEAIRHGFGNLVTGLNRPALDKISMAVDGVEQTSIRACSH